MLRQNDQRGVGRLRGGYGTRPSLREGVVLVQDRRVAFFEFARAQQK